MQVEKATPRDLECLFDQTSHLERGGILSKGEADDIRGRISKRAEGKTELAEYFQLIADTNRQVVDLMKNPGDQQWIAKCISRISESAFLDLKKAGLFKQAEWLNVSLKLFPRKHAEVDSSIPLADLGLSVRTSNALEAADIGTINDLLKLTEEELLEIRNFGKTCLKEVQKTLWNRFQVKLAIRE